MSTQILEREEVEIEEICLELEEKLDESYAATMRFWNH